MNNAHTFVESQLNKNQNTKHAKNVIFFIGDGMSIPTIAAARNLMGGEEEQLSFQNFPHTGMVKTYCVDAQVADSACSATAYHTGVKGNDGTIGVNAQIKYADCDLLSEDVKTDSIAKWFMDGGRDAGLVTTTRVTHASPAGVFSNTAARAWERDTQVTSSKCDNTIIDDIAEQLVRNNVGNRLKVIMGGGRREFIPVDSNNIDYEMFKGLRQDGVNLIDEWLAAHAGGKFVSNLEELSNVNANEVDSLMGLFHDSHLLYRLEAEALDQVEYQPTLSDMTRKAIEILSKNENGYYLFVEGEKE